MFAPETIASAIAAIEQSQSLKIVEHPVVECTRVYDHFASLTRTDGKHTWYQRGEQPPEQFEFASWESEWIRNEMFLCACSFPYWLWRYYFIKDIAGNIRRPNQSVAWLLILDVLADMDRKHLPMLLLFLKARQLGITTLMEAIILWIALFRRGCRNVIASAEEDKSILMSDMIWLALDNLPLWMRPNLTRDDRQVGPEFGDNETEILIQHGSMKKGIARGSTPTACHASEVAYFPDWIETIESSLIRAMHENPRTFLSLESTARRKGDDFHRTWEKNRRGEATGYNRFTCIFLPWYVGRDIYPTKYWIQNHPIPVNWIPRKETIKQAADARLYVSTTPLLRKYMGEGWEMDREQQWFWEFNYVEAADSDQTLKSFMAEMASDERSCFTSKRWSVYSQSVLDRVREDLPTENRCHIYALVGDGIDASFHLRDYWSARSRRIDIGYYSIREKMLAWRLIPLIRKPEEEDAQCFLRIWEHPQPGYRYTIGNDVGGGVRQNKTTFEILRIGRNAEDPDIQVAQIYSPLISAVQAPPFALALGAYYGQYMYPVREAYLAPETQIAVGDLVSSQLASDGYSNFHYMERYDLRKTPGHKSRRRGWVTNAWSKPLMQQSFKHGVDNGWIQINSPDTLTELENQEAEETDSGKTQFDHADDANDDSLTGLEIAYFVSHDQETLTERMAGKLRPRTAAKLDNGKAEKPLPGMVLGYRFQREDKEEIGQYDESEDGYGIPVF